MVAVGKNQRAIKTSLVQRLFLATRPWSFTASINGVLLGSALAFHQQSDVAFSWGIFFATVCGALSVHTFGNVLNTYADYKSGLDRPETSDDRTMFDLQLTEAHVVSLISFAAVCSLISAVYVYTQVEARVFPIFVAGGLFTLCYSAVLKLKYRMLGDVCIFFAFGPLLVVGTYVIQMRCDPLSPACYSMALHFSVPLGLLTELILHINNARDINTDRRAGARTVAQVIGFRGCLIAGFAMLVGAYVSSAYLALSYFGSGLWAVVAAVVPVLATLPISVPLMKHFGERKWGRASESLCANAAQLGFVFTTLQVAAVVASRLL